MIFGPRQMEAGELIIAGWPSHRCLKTSFLLIDYAYLRYARSITPGLPSGVVSFARPYVMNQVTSLATNRRDLYLHLPQCLDKLDRLVSMLILVKSISWCWYQAAAGHNSQTARNWYIIEDRTFWSWKVLATNWWTLILFTATSAMLIVTVDERLHKLSRRRKDDLLLITQRTRNDPTRGTDHLGISFWLQFWRTTKWIIPVGCLNHLSNIADNGVETSHDWSS